MIGTRGDENAENMCPSAGDVAGQTQSVDGGSHEGGIVELYPFLKSLIKIVKRKAIGERYQIEWVML